MITLTWKSEAYFKDGNEFRYDLLTYFEDVPQVIGYGFNGATSNDFPAVVFDYSSKEGLAKVHVYSDDKELISVIKSRVQLAYSVSTIEEHHFDESLVASSDVCNDFRVTDFSLNGKEIKQAFKERNMGLFRNKEVMKKLVVNRIFAGVMRWQKMSGVNVITDPLMNKNAFVCDSDVEYDDIIVERTSRGARAVVTNLRFKAKMDLGEYPLFIGAEVNKGFGKVIGYVT